MTGDPRFDLRRPPHARTGLYAPARPAVIVPPPLRREPAPSPPSWRPGAVLRPAAVADDDLDATPDVQTLPSQLDHEPEGVL